MTQSRDSSIDALRSVALFGILVVNLPFFAMPYGFAGAAWQAHGPLWANVGAAALIQGLFESKFILIFSALFGYGAYWQLSRRGTAPFIFRLAALGGLGIVNLLFVFEADILLPYALLGLGLVPASRLPARALVSASLAAWVLAVAGAAGFGLKILLLPAEASGGPSLSDLMRQGSFADMMAWRLEAWASFQTYCLWSTYWLVASALLAGFAAARRVSEEGADALAHQLRRLARLLLLPAALAVLAYGGLSAIPAPTRPDMLFLATSVLRPALAPVVSLVIVGVALSAFRSPKGRRLAALLSPAGRLSLTLYIGTGLAMSLLFFGYGLGLSGSVSLAGTLAIVLLLYAVSLLFAHLWEQRFGLGPLERLLALVTRKGAARVRTPSPGAAVRS